MTEVINVRDLEKLNRAIREGRLFRIHRPSEFGNPYTHKDGTLAIYKVASRAEAILAYEKWILTQPQLLARLPELKGKVLACFCHPLACHGDVLARLADHGVPVPMQGNLF